MTRKNITVTRKDIWNGIPRNSGACPIATCLRRLFPTRLIAVYNTYCTVGRYKAMLPTEAVDFTFWVDAHPKLRYLKRPFSFSLEFHDMDIADHPDYIEDKYYNSELT